MRFDPPDPAEAEMKRLCKALERAGYELPLSLWGGHFGIGGLRKIVDSVEDLVHRVNAIDQNRQEHDLRAVEGLAMWAGTGTVKRGR